LAISGVALEHDHRPGLQTVVTIFSLQQFVTLSSQDFELGFLFGNPLRNQFVVGGAGICGRLLNELTDIFPDSRHAPLDFSQRQWNFGHESSVIIVRKAATYRQFYFTTAAGATEVHR
jgi:hypothetical protein